FSLTPTTTPLFPYTTLFRSGSRPQRPAGRERARMPKAPAQKRKRVAATSGSESQAAIREHDFLAPVFAQYPIEVASAQGVWLTSSRGERVLDRSEERRVGEGGRCGGVVG